MELKSQKNIKSQEEKFRFFTVKTTNMFNKPFLNHAVCHIIFWLVVVVLFSTNRNMFSCLQTLPPWGHFCDKSRFYSFFLHQTQNKHDGKVRKSVTETIYHPSPVLDALAHPSSQEVERGRGQAASYT